MSSLSQFTGGGGLVPKGLFNGASKFALHDIGAGTFSNIGLATVTTGAVTSGVLTTVLNLSGRGAIGYLGARNAAAIAQTERIKVTIDGVVVFDDTSPSSSSGTVICAAIGSIIGSAAPYILVPEWIQFNQSLLVEYACNRTASGTAQIGYRYVAR